MPGPEWVEQLARVLLTAVLVGSVGLERELRGKPAGLRTVLLIGVGAELLTEVSLTIVNFAPHDLVRADPGRVAAQIVSGVGFIGAGTILVNRNRVVGLTTAASLWVSAAIGMLVGVRLYPLAICAAALVIVTLVLLGWLERKFLPGIEPLTVRVAIPAGDTHYDRLLARLEAAGVESQVLEWAGGARGAAVTLRLRGTGPERQAAIRSLVGMEGLETLTNLSEDDRDASPGFD